MALILLKLVNIVLHRQWLEEITLINYIYQLVSPKVFSIKYDEMEIGTRTIIKPSYMSICHADQRYYLGHRDRSILNKKLPMALIHECCGEVVYDPSGKFKPGQLVTMIPNTPTTVNDEIYENYREGSYFLSSGYDGFLREYVDIDSDRVVSLEGVPGYIGAITEFVSVAIHATTRFDIVSHRAREWIGIWGDGSLAFVVGCTIKSRFPESRIVVLGKDSRKLSYFSFADKTFLINNIQEDFRIDHAFECCGGEGSCYAIDDIIRYIRPQGSVMLMGVSENKVLINTRDVLEKGLSLVGSSRSGIEDFEMAAELMRDSRLQNRLKLIIYQEEPVDSVEDIHRTFRNDMSVPFKTVFKWEL